MNLLTDLWITSLLFDLNNKFIIGSFAFSPGLIYILAQSDPQTDLLLFPSDHTFWYLLFVSHSGPRHRTIANVPDPTPQTLDLKPFFLFSHPWLRH